MFDLMPAASALAGRFSTPGALLVVCSDCDGTGVVDPPSHVPPEIARVIGLPQRLVGAAHQRGFWCAECSGTGEVLL